VIKAQIVNWIPTNYCSIMTLCLTKGEALDVLKFFALLRCRRVGTRRCVLTVGSDSIVKVGYWYICRSTLDAIDSYYTCLDHHGYTVCLASKFASGSHWANHIRTNDSPLFLPEYYINNHCYLIPLVVFFISFQTSRLEMAHNIDYPLFRLPTEL